MEKDKIKELRSLVPIPMQIAKTMLQENNFDVDKCVQLFKKKTIADIVLETGCDEKIASEVYEKEKFDILRTISIIKDLMFDKTYEPISGVDHENLLYIRDWLSIMQNNDFGISLGYKHLQKVIDVFDRIPKLNHLSALLQAAKNDYDRVFEGYTDSKPLSEFVRLNKELDDCPSFQISSKKIPLELELIRDEIRKHWRNVVHPE